MRVVQAVSAAARFAVPFVLLSGLAGGAHATDASEFDSEAPDAIACSTLVELVSTNAVRYEEYRAWLEGLAFARAAPGAEPVDPDAAMDAAIAACRTDGNKRFSDVAGGQVKQR